jgi:hypothetical protein
MLAALFLAIALIYPTYATFQSMTEDVRHSLDPLRNASATIKEMFQHGGWDIDAEIDSTIETTTIRNQLAFTFLAAIEAVFCILFAAMLRAGLKP